MKRIIRNAILGIILLPLISAVHAGQPFEADPPEHWAEPMEVAGVPNLHKISDTLYRSAQPTAEGLNQLMLLGIKTVVNLRSFHSDRDEIEGSGLEYEHINMKAWHPKKEEVVRFLQIVTDKARAPILVHCQHGADRTGTMCAIYRIIVQGWSKQAALEEMTDGGFGFHGIFSNLIEWVSALDTLEIKHLVGI